MNLTHKPARLGVLATLAVALLSALFAFAAQPAMAASPTCANATYPDGKTAYRACVAWTDPAGSTWFAYETYAWNPTVANNGHTDNFPGMKVTGAGGLDCCNIDQLTDGETQTITDHQWQQGNNSVWFAAESTYDGWCYRVFIRPNTASSDRVANC